jgi:hypothetical protein
MLCRSLRLSAPQLRPAQLLLDGHARHPRGQKSLPWRAAEVERKFCGKAMGMIIRKLCGISITSQIEWDFESTKPMTLGASLAGDRHGGDQQGKLVRS